MLRPRGALLGLAVGDALGTTLEFKTRDAYPKHSEMIGGGPFRLQPGQWTDDTSMALCLADSLIHCHGFDPSDLMARFVSWYRTGENSSTGHFFDIGITTRAALEQFERNGNPYAGSTDPTTAGNGSLMRVAPVAIFALDDEQLALKIAADQSCTTHAAPAAIEACQLLVALLRAAILGHNDVVDLARQLGRNNLTLNKVSARPWRRTPSSEIDASGFVLSTLSAALWAIANSSDFEDALVLAVNLGQDADTTGAVTGQLAGAIYGASSIPDRWLRQLTDRKHIVDRADRLLDAGPS